jgi:hypothetical protein
MSLEINTLLILFADRVLIHSPDEIVEYVKSHKLIQLKFSLRNRIFYYKLVSDLICYLAFERIKKLEKNELEKQLELYKNQNTIVYDDMYKKYLIKSLIGGLPITYRVLRNSNDYDGRFGECATKFFCCVSHPPIQIWY